MNDFEVSPVGSRKDLEARLAQCEINLREMNIAWKNQVSHVIQCEADKAELVEALKIIATGQDDDGFLINGEYPCSMAEGLLAKHTGDK